LRREIYAGKYCGRSSGSRCGCLCASQHEKAGGDAAKMSDLDWSKVQLVSDTYSPEAAYHYEGTLKFTFKNNVLGISGTLKHSK